jgi:hypothetical protein
MLATWLRWSAAILQQGFTPPDLAVDQLPDGGGGQGCEIRGGWRTGLVWP